MAARVVALRAAMHVVVECWSWDIASSCILDHGILDRSPLGQDGWNDRSLLAIDART